MKKTNTRFNLPFLIIAMSPLLLAACGGSSGDSAPAATTPTPTPTSPPTPLPQKQEQTITPFSVKAMKVGESTTVTATASSGLAVTFTSDTPSTCAVTPTGAVTAIGYGTCTVAANQFGNDTYRQLTVRSSALVIGAQSLTLTLPQLMVDESVAAVFSATSQLPVTLTSNTQSICTVKNGLITVNPAAPAGAVCSITASQNGVANYFAAATPVTATTNIIAANTSLLPYATPALTAPETGSLASESYTVHEGYYFAAGAAGALIDKNDNISYLDSLGVLFGSLTFTPSTSSSWVLNPSSLYYSFNPHELLTATGSGTLTPHSNFSASAAGLSFGTNPSPVNLTYGAANAFAVEVASFDGIWYSDATSETSTATITNRTQLKIDGGVVTGTIVTLNTAGLPSRCLLNGTLSSSDNGTKHNMFDLSFTATTDTASGMACALNTNLYQGHAVKDFNLATKNLANGVFPSFFAITRTSDNSLQSFALFKQLP